jgi:bacterial/archaeal transporter family protein
MDESYSRVAPIDKMSLPLTLIFAAIFPGETLTWRLTLGVALMTAGALITLES